MANITEIARQCKEAGIVKAVSGDYVIYKRKWLYEHIEQEYVLIKSVKDFKPIKDGITRLREFIAQQEVSR